MIEKPDLSEEFFTPKESFMTNGLTNSRTSSFYSTRGTITQTHQKHNFSVKEIRESISEISSHENDDMSSSERDGQQQSEESKNQSNTGPNDNKQYTNTNNPKAFTSSFLSNRNRKSLKNSNEIGIQLIQGDSLSLNQIQSPELRSTWSHQSEMILLKVIELNDSSFDSYERIYEEKKVPHKLKIHVHSYINTEKHRVNKTRSEWYVPCTPEQFIKFMNNVPEQNKLDNKASMSDFRVIDNFNKANDKEHMILYLAYKKMIATSARDFIYLKHVRKINDGTWCDASTSIDHPEFPVHKNKIRGQIILSGHVAREVIDTQTNKTRTVIRLYSEIDFKANIPLIMAKKYTISEMKKYIEKCILRLNTIYPPSS